MDIDKFYFFADFVQKGAQAAESAKTPAICGSEREGCSDSEIKNPVKILS